MSELHDKDGMLKKSVPDKGAETINIALGPKGAAGVFAKGIGKPSAAMAATGLSKTAKYLGFTNEPDFPSSRFDIRDTGASISSGYVKVPGYKTTPSSNVISITSPGTGMTRVETKAEFRKESIDNTVDYALSNNENVRDLVEERVKSVNNAIMDGERTAYGASKDIMSTFSDTERKYLLTRHSAAKLNHLAYDSEVGGMVITRAIAANKDVASMKESLDFVPEGETTGFENKYSEIIEAKDKVAKELFMESGKGDEDAYYDEMREDYMKSISDQIDKESSKSDDKNVTEISSIDNSIVMDDPDLPMGLDMGLDDPDVPADYRNPDGSVNAKYNSDDGMDY